ncbi:MAG: anaerobic ribonucleoside triphosphate reductase [Bacteroidales bacterium]|nr:anaerobic ribonucleoside triphosphate reductase [Bacteroidales bacterium]MBR1782660.1 anaerobic ribonucleoside triphosphate reductase [Bacteroidales bacterium]
MVKSVLKRDGRRVDFNNQKIVAAILKAMDVTDAGEDIVLAAQIAQNISELDRDEMTVEEIQEVVENHLMNSPRQEVAKEYIRYRNKRNIARKAKSNEIFETIIQAQVNDITRENANMNADTPAGMMMKFASEATKSYVDECLLSDPVRDAVAGNYIHIHDKDYYPTKSLTCIQHPLDKILEHGLKAGHGESRPAKRIETASVLACISMETVQNEMHGGQAIPAFDFYLAPYVRKTFEEEVEKVGAMMNADYSDLKTAPIDDYLKRDLTGLQGKDRAFQHAINQTVGRVHQAMEAFVHNMNTIHSRGGNQVVFSSINYGTDTSAEGRCIIREILNTTYEGVGNGSTAIFPIQIWKKKRGVSYLPEDPNYDLYKFACKVSARRFFPNFLNLDASFNQDDAWKADDPKRYEHEVATMGCRTRVYGNKFGPKTSIGRGNLSFTTINIVKLAIEAMNEEKDKTARIQKFFGKLDWALEIAARQLNERFEFQKTALKKQFPLLMAGLWLGSEKLDDEDTIESVINQGTLSIGFIGLAECLIALIGKHHGESEEAQELGLRIVSHMAEKINGFAETYQHNFTFLGTPAEGLAGKFTKRDKKTFGVLPGITDKDYYTNSSHVPVYYHCTPEHKAMIEGPYHKYENAGHIFYVEVDGDATHNPEAIMRIVDLMDKYDIGYGSVNHNRNRCMDCGYENADDNLTECPHCHGHHIDTLQRITGYLVGTTDRWNSGKLAELKDRVVHK